MEGKRAILLVAFNCFYISSHKSIRQSGLDIVTSRSMSHGGEAVDLSRQTRLALASPGDGAR